MIKFEQFIVLGISVICMCVGGNTILVSRATTSINTSLRKIEELQDKVQVLEALLLKQEQKKVEITKKK